MKCPYRRKFGGIEGPTPHGVGGLKYVDAIGGLNGLPSHPSRGGWIEIIKAASGVCVYCSPTPHGVGGLKCENVARATVANHSPTPHGVGGLKCMGRSEEALPRWSHPSRGGWIEIHSEVLLRLKARRSHPSRGGWIEICKCCERRESMTVPPLTGWVD